MLADGSLAATQARAAIIIVVGVGLLVVSRWEYLCLTCMQSMHERNYNKQNTPAIIIIIIIIC
jgi:hypothetical protein